MGFLRAFKRRVYSTVPYTTAIVLCLLILIPAWHVRDADLTVLLSAYSDHNLSHAFLANFVREGLGRAEWRARNVIVDLAG
jgi:hypothetical protein